MKKTRTTTRTESIRSVTHVETTVEDYDDSPSIGQGKATGKAPRNPSWTLDKFSISAISNVGARPGKTELRARVALHALNMVGDTVSIPDDELHLVLGLVNYDDGLALPDWAIEFDSPGDSGSSQQSIDFWITTSKPCGPRVFAAASILPPGAPAPVHTRPPSGFDSYVDLDNLVVNPRWEITTFKLERVSASDRVYINGLQQIKLKAELAFTDLTTGRPGVPTPEELASVTIAFADEGTPLPFDNPRITGEGQGVAWWVTSPGVAGSDDLTYDRGYLPYPGVVGPVDVERPVSAESSRASIFRYFLVACRKVPAQKVQLCAYAKCADGWVYRTNGKNTDPCGGIHDDGANSQLDVLGVTPDVGTIDRYPWVREVLSGDDDGVGAPGEVVNPDSVHKYTLSFTDAWGNEVGIRSIDVEPAGMIQWHGKVPGEHRACFTGFAAPGSKTLVWNSAIPQGPTPLPTLSSADERLAAVVLVGRQDIAYQSGKPNGPCVLKTRDWYGNANTLHVRFASETGDGRWTLELYR